MPNCECNKQKWNIIQTQIRVHINILYYIIYFWIFFDKSGLILFIRFTQKERQFQRLLFCQRIKQEYEMKIYSKLLKWNSWFQYLFLFFIHSCALCLANECLAAKWETAIDNRVSRHQSQSLFWSSTCARWGWWRRRRQHLCPSVSATDSLAVAERTDWLYDQRSYRTGAIKYEENLLHINL